MSWDTVVEKVRPYIVSIETPRGTGTGFLCLYNNDHSMCGIATVLNHYPKTGSVRAGT